MVHLIEGTSAMTEVTQDNWLILAGKLQPGEYLRVRKGRLNMKDMIAAVEKQYPGPMREHTSSLTRSHLGVTFHGDMIMIFRADSKGHTHIDNPPRWQES